MANSVVENKKVIANLKKLAKGLPLEVLGHFEAPALCCRSGTVALVKVDLASNPPPDVKKAGK